MKYYLHDSNSFSDEKITELFIYFGYEGLGLFYTLLEKLALQEKPIKTSVLKSQLKVGKKLEKCWKFMESIELIHSNNDETFNKQLMNFSGKYAIKKEKNTKRISEWRDKQELTKNVTCYESVRNTCKVKESKVKESKVKESKVNNNNNSNSEIPNFSESDKFILTLKEEWRFIVKKWLDYKKEKKQAYKGETSLNTMFNQLKKLSNESPQKAIEIIDYSIGNNYTGFFQPKENNSTGSYKSESTQRKEAAANLHQMSEQIIKNSKVDLSKI